MKYHKIVNAIGNHSDLLFFRFVKELQNDRQRL